MSKLNSMLSYNSGTSSETSETPSVEENQPSDSVTPGSGTPPISGSGSKIPKSWRRMKDSSNDKDGEAKRPPWRAVSVSTLPKPDKNALLRAKLLDASRRLRAGKVAVGVQTDIIPTKLMKEVSLGAQTDLILLKEIGVLTDGSYAKRRDGSDEYILTYSVPLMTDTVESTCVSTQTLIPRYPGDDFFDAYGTNEDAQYSQHTQQCSDTEKQLLAQLSRLRKAVIPLTAQLGDKVTHCGEATQDDANNDSFSEADTDTTTDTIRTLVSIENAPTQSSGYSTYRPLLSFPTQLSWHFEYDPDLPEYSKKPPLYTISASRPWNSFEPLSYLRYQSIDLSSLLESIDGLIQESIRLADLIERIMKQAKKRFDVNLFDVIPENIAQVVPIIHQPPSSYWLPIIEEQEKALAELKRFKSSDISKLQKYV